MKTSLITLAVSLFISSFSMACPLNKNLQSSVSIHNKSSNFYNVAKLEAHSTTQSITTDKVMRRK